MSRCLVVLATSLIVTLAGGAVRAQSRATAGFEKLKSLVGEWQGTTPDDRTVDVTYQLISGGTALMETLQSPNEPEMVTIYHLDGDRLMVTHYCSIGNQPRLVAQVPAGEIKSLNFTLLEVTNLTKPSAGHICSLGVAFEDRDHLKQTWAYRQDGKDVAETFNLKRKK